MTKILPSICNLFFTDNGRFFPPKHVAYLLYELSRTGPIIRSIQGNQASRNLLMRISNGEHQFVRENEEILNELMNLFPTIYLVSARHQQKQACF